MLSDDRDTATAEQNSAQNIQITSVWYGSKPRISSHRSLGLALLTSNRDGVGDIFLGTDIQESW